MSIAFEVIAVILLACGVFGIFSIAAAAERAADYLKVVASKQY